MHESKTCIFNHQQKLKQIWSQAPTFQALLIPISAPALTSLMVSSGLSCSSMAWRCLCRVSEAPEPFFTGEVTSWEEVSFLRPPASPSSSRRTAPLTRAKLSLDREINFKPLSLENFVEVGIK